MWGYRNGAVVALRLEGIDQMQFQAEYTDTFGGEANYAWVRRAEFEAPADASDALVMRRAKKALGLSGVRGKREDAGEYLALYPFGSCTVLFVNPVY